MKMYIIATIALLVSFNATAAEIDMKKSSITWKASKVTGATHTGQVIPTSSSIQVKEGKITSGLVTFNMKTFTVTDLKGKWADKFLGHVKSSDFLDVEKYPTATLKILSVEKGQGTGELTVMGKTNRIVFSIKATEGKFVGTTTFDRTQFGMTYGSDNFFKGLGDKAISDLVSIGFDISLTR
jgi:polyisoprenoid-binding protein YceI